MATLKDIRKRIASVRNTQKITKAMKMVAAAKLRRAQTRLTNARPYATKMAELLNQMVHLMREVPHPIFEKRESVKVAEFLILTSDRGLCGGFNGNLLRRVEGFMKEKGTTCEQIKISIFGRKGRDYFRARRREPDQFFPSMVESVPFEQVLKIAEDIISRYVGKNEASDLALPVASAGVRGPSEVHLEWTERGPRSFDEFYLVYNYFKSAISQEIRIEKILPLSTEVQRSESSFLPEYLYEPSKKEVLETLIPRALATIIRQAFLESVTGEYGARMMAMDNATNNSVDMIYRLTLQMNRIRQAAITKELMDIVNGAESLK